MRSMKQAQAYPLQWPDGWTRTRAKLRRTNYNWKQNFGVYRGHLIDEMLRLGARDLVLSTDIPVNKSNGLPREGFNPPDPGVAVYFNRAEREDFSWQEVLELEIDGQLAREALIALVNQQFRRLSKTCHPDTPRPDAALFQRLSKAREQGLDYLNGKTAEGHGYTLACDKFDEVRLNMHAIGLTVESLRQMERCGATSMLERAFRGFQMALPARASKAS